jgi:anti-sigma factor RsiW
MTHADAVSTLATERYLLDEMPELEREAFEAHYFECPECAEDVDVGSQMREGVRSGLLLRSPVSHPAFAIAQTPTPMPSRRLWTPSTVLPWAVAATLAVAVGYQSLPAPRPATGSDTIAALTPTVLRPASRGTAPVVSGESGHMALALDLDAEGAPELAYVLRGADGREMLAGTSAAPPAGSPLILVVPTFTLTVQQQYILSVRDAARPDRPLGEFTFTAGTSR